MAAREFTVRARIEAVDAATPTVQRAERSFSSLANTLVRRFIGVAALVQTIRALGRQFTESAKEAIALEANARKLGTTLDGVAAGSADVGVSLDRIAGAAESARAKFGLAVVSTAELRENLDALADAAQKDAGIMELLGTITGTVLAKAAGLGAKALEELNFWTRQVSVSLAQLRPAAEGAADSVGSAAVAFDRMTDGQIRAFAIQQDVEAGFRGLDAILKQLGITVEDPVRKIETLNAVLEEIREQAKIADTEGLRLLELRAKAVQAEITKLEEKLRGSTDALTDYSGAIEGAADSTEDLAQSNVQLQRALVAVEHQLVRTTAQFDAMRRAAGTAAAVEAAIAGGGELVLGGTRVRLPGGGSRLTRPPGLSNNLRF